MNEDKVVKDIENIIDKWKQKEINGDECLYQIRKELDKNDEEVFKFDESSSIRYEKTIESKIVYKGDYPFPKIEE